MPTPITDYDYHLPEGHIAQHPANPREAAKLLVLDRKNNTLTHGHVSDLPKYFHHGDVLVINNTKVFRARLHGTTNGKSVELFLIRPREGTHWLALGKPGKKITPGSAIIVSPDFTAQVLEKLPDGTLIVDFALPPTAVIERANQHGTVPVPPYIRTLPDASEYQTSYAKYEGSVAAPTAGFHFTPGIRDALTNKGVIIVELTLHVGLGTFLPIKSQTIEEHTIHSEWVHVSANAAEVINVAKRDKRRVIAVGTTSVRTLEGVADKHMGQMVAYQGDIDLFITPGYSFKIVDGMATNFHLPKSTLIVLVAAFAGRENILDAYREAINRGYRFYSFGDAMLIL